MHCNILQRVMGTSRFTYLNARALSSGSKAVLKAKDTTSNSKSTSTSTQSDASRTKTSKIPEGTYKAVAILTGSQFISNCGFGCVIPVLPLFAAEMGLGPSGVGLILSTTAVSRLLVSGGRERVLNTRLRRCLLMAVCRSRISCAPLRPGLLRISYKPFLHHFSLHFSFFTYFPEPNLRCLGLTCAPLHPPPPTTCTFDAV